MSLYEFDNIYRQTYPVLCGIDEAGRGPLAGNVYCAAVIFGENTVIEGINDSKKLSEKKRETLYGEITDKAEKYAIVSVSIDDIEKYNILQATLIGMKRAYLALETNVDIALIDGDKLPDLPCKSEYVTKGDAQSASIAAASILAKVARDRYMLDLHEKYPMYGFNKHKGYGTKLHVEAVKKYGACEVHRMSFLKKILK